MKKSILTLVLFLYSNLAFAQFTLNGSNLYYNGSNVGIGTSTPISTFQVIGNTRIVENQSGLLFSDWVAQQRCTLMEVTVILQVGIMLLLNMVRTGHNHRPHTSLEFKTPNFIHNKAYENKSTDFI